MASNLNGHLVFDLSRIFSREEVLKIYYNDWEPSAVAWLRELIQYGLLPEGDVDSRSIKEVTADDVRGYDQCHFFAGIGGWPLALQIAGLATGKSIWTGSCPCQPFSQAGKRKGTDDERHLWPEFARLINECRPATVFGEQVASKAGREWLAVVFDDLEAMGYAAAGADLCAAGVGAPHIRQRLWWVADNGSQGLERWTEQSTQQERQAVERGCEPCSVGNSFINDMGRDGRNAPRAEAKGNRAGKQDGVSGEQLRLPITTSSMADTDGGQSSDGNLQRSRQHGLQSQSCQPDSMEHAAGDGWRQGQQNVARCDERSQAEGPHRRFAVRGNDGFWGDFDLIYCTDEKYRPVEPSSFPLAHGVSGRVAQLRGLGNAIVPQVAAEFIRAAWDSIGGKLN